MVRFPVCGVLVLCSGALATACGGSAEPVAEPAARTPAATAVEEVPPEGAAPARAKVTIEDFEYEPATVTVKAGGKVTFTDADTTNHTVTFTSAKAGRGIPNIRPGQTRSIRLPRAGTFAYICEFHPTMRGEIVAR